MARQERKERLYRDIYLAETNHLPTFSYYVYVRKGSNYEEKATLYKLATPTRSTFQSACNKLSDVGHPCDNGRPCDFTLPRSLVHLQRVLRGASDERLIRRGP